MKHNKIRFILKTVSHICTNKELKTNFKILSIVVTVGYFSVKVTII
jgi:hypothetical protein